MFDGWPLWAVIVVSLLIGALGAIGAAQYLWLRMLRSLFDGPYGEKENDHSR